VTAEPCCAKPAPPGRGPTCFVPWCTRLGGDDGRRHGRPRQQLLLQPLHHPALAAAKGAHQHERLQDGRHAGPQARKRRLHLPRRYAGVLAGDKQLRGSSRGVSISCSLRCVQRHPQRLKSQAPAHLKVGGSA
jgi:hypothetical protein